jgi:hypothetical protein
MKTCTNKREESKKMFRFLNIPIENGYKQSNLACPSGRSTSWALSWHCGPWFEVRWAVTFCAVFIHQRPLTQRPSNHLWTLWTGWPEWSVNIPRFEGLVAGHWLAMSVTVPSMYLGPQRHVVTTLPRVTQRCSARSNTTVVYLPSLHCQNIDLGNGVWPTPSHIDLWRFVSGAGEQLNGWVRQMRPICCAHVSRGRANQTLTVDAFTSK